MSLAVLMLLFLFLTQVLMHCAGLFALSSLSGLTAVSHRAFSPWETSAVLILLKSKMANKIVHLSLLLP